MLKIELDDYDIGILAFLTDMPNKTTSDVAKALFKEPRNLTKLDGFIRYRIKRLAEGGLIKQNRDHGKSHYSVDGNKVRFGNGVLKMDGIEEVEIGYFIVIKTKDGTIAQSIDDYEQRIGVSKIFHEKRI